MHATLRVIDAYPRYLQGSKACFFFRRLGKKKLKQVVKETYNRRENDACLRSSNKVDGDQTVGIEVVLDLLLPRCVLHFGP